MNREQLLNLLDCGATVARYIESTGEKVPTKDSPDIVTIRDTTVIAIGVQLAEELEEPTHDEKQICKSHSISQILTAGAILYSAPIGHANQTQALKATQAALMSHALEGLE